MLWSPRQAPEFYSGFPTAFVQRAQRKPKGRETILRIGVSSIPLVTIVTLLSALVFWHAG